MSDVTVRLQLTPKSKPLVVHVDRLKPYTGVQRPVWAFRPNRAETGQSEDRQPDAAGEEAVLTDSESAPDDMFRPPAGGDDDTSWHDEMTDPVLGSCSDGDEDDQGVTSWSDGVLKQDWGSTSPAVSKQSAGHESIGRKQYPRRNRRPPKYFY